MPNKRRRRSTPSGAWLLRRCAPSSATESSLLIGANTGDSCFRFSAVGHANGRSYAWASCCLFSTHHFINYAKSVIDELGVRLEKLAATETPGPLEFCGQQPVTRPLVQMGQQ